MGLIRFLLACSVVIFHSSPVFGLSMMHGGLAVEAFFVISGFYMALVLNEKYTRSQYDVFIVNRLLRLMPAYGITLLLAVLLNAVLYITLGKSIYTFKLWVELLAQGQWWHFPHLIFTHLTMLGQEVYQLLRFSPDGAIQFVGKLPQDWVDGKSYMFLPQAWSISVEIQFYLIAPFLVRLSSARIGAIIALVWVLRIWMLHFWGSDGAGINYLIMPCQLYLFLLGALAYKAYRFIQGKLSEKVIHTLGKCFLILTVSWIVLFQFPNWSFEVKQCFSILLTALATPWIFYLTRHVYWDRVLGELGYPIYIVHVTIGQVSDRVLEQLGWSERGLVLLVLTLPASWLIYRFVDQPIDAMRQKRLKSVSS